jgi:hypothetical protein
MNKKGAIFITVLIISMLMVFVAVTVSNMLLQDTHMIRHLKNSTDAQNLAEAGISRALAELSANGFAAIGSIFPLSDSLGNGSFTVNIAQTGGRYLMSSTGTSGNVSRIAAMEIEDNTATALRYLLTAGNDMRVRSFFLGLSDFNGDLQANHDVRLRTQALSLITVDPCGSDIYCSGDVSAGNQVSLSTGLGSSINIAGNVTNDAVPVTFPQFDYALYKSEAIAGGDYYAGDKTWTGASISPSNGVVYVEGTAIINGTCDLYGGLVASRIRINGELKQHSAGNKNVVIARGDNTVGDIEVFNKIDIGQAMVYVQRDFTVQGVGGTVAITGTLMVARNLIIWNSLSYVTYNHVMLTPEGLLGPSGQAGVVTIISWNR